MRKERGIQKGGGNPLLNLGVSLGVNDEEENEGRTIIKDPNKMKSRLSYWDIPCVRKDGQISR